MVGAWLACWTVVACGNDAPPPVTVGAVSFQESQLLGLTPARRTTLARLTAFGLAVADSTLGALGTPLTTRWAEDALLETLAAELALEAEGVGDAVLEARYLTDPEYELTVRHILFFSERWRTAGERAEARAKAERALEAIRTGADFAETAAALSEEPGAEGRQGLLTPGRRGAWVDEFWNAASLLRPGEISPVTETQYGFHILRLEDRTVVPFAEARARIAREVAGQVADPAAVLDAWLDERLGDVDPDAAVVSAIADGTATPEQVLAAVPGGSPLTVQGYLDRAATERPAWPGRPGSGDTDAVRASVVELLRRATGVAEAGSRGLELAASERARVERRWDDLAYRWSASLGFAGGLAPGRVAEAALAALGDPAQGAAIVREEVDAYGPLLERRYPITVRSPGA